MQRKTYGRCYGNARKPFKSLSSNNLFDQILETTSTQNSIGVFEDETIYRNSSSSSSSANKSLEVFTEKSVLFESPPWAEDRNISGCCFLKTSIFEKRRKPNHGQCMKVESLKKEKMNAGGGTFQQIAFENWQDVENFSFVVEKGNLSRSTHPWKSESKNGRKTSDRELIVEPTKQKSTLDSSVIQSSKETLSPSKSVPLKSGQNLMQSSSRVCRQRTKKRLLSLADENKLNSKQCIRKKLSSGSSESPFNDFRSIRSSSIASAKRDELRRLTCEQNPKTTHGQSFQRQGLQTSTPNELVRADYCTGQTTLDALGISPLLIQPCWVSLSPMLASTFADKKKRRSMSWHKVLCSELLQKSYWTDNPKGRVLELCHQSKPLPFSSLLPKNGASKFHKLGEGSYAEVFCNGSQVLKIVPILDTRESFGDILSEIVVSMELSSLAENCNFLCPNYIHCQRVCCIRGKYPKSLQKEWKLYAARKGTENDCPDKYPASQLYIIFDFANGGTNLESCKFTDAVQMVSMFSQVVAALAVAEESLEFEHRDLHWGNVLIASTSRKHLDYALRNESFSLPSAGVIVSIIDFTLSRLLKGQCIFYTDLSKDQELFEGEGDYQFDVYRQMQNLGGDTWSRFQPHSNVLWLRYLLQKLTTERRFPRKPRRALTLLHSWRQRVQKYSSATHFLRKVLLPELDP